MPAPLILIEAAPRRVADGVAETVRLAGGGGTKPYYYDGQHWRAGIAKLPSVITSLNFDGGEIGTAAIPQAAEIEWQPGRPADLAAMAGYFWADAAITMRIGAEGATPPIVLSGKVLDAPVDSGVLKLMLSDPAADLKKPLLTDRYAGTGGLEGPAEWDGKIKRRVWGRVWNIAGEPIDKANSIYAFADPTRRLQSIDAVRDKGAGAGALTTVPWAGSAAATFAALQAAAAPVGGGVIAPSIACVKWWTTPAGELTADIKGEIGAGYVETSAAIAQRLVEARGGPAFAAGTVAAAAALRPAPVGWVARDENTTAAAMLEELLGNSSLLWQLSSAGEIVIRPWAWGASVATATSHSVTRRKVLRPLATRKLGYRRNETPMSRGDLAAIVLAGDVLYSDGRSVETALADAIAAAEAHGTLTNGGPLPPGAESAVGDTHIGDDGTIYDRVEAGGILLGGFALVLDGYRPQMAWTPAASQPLRDAITQANAAYSGANAAIDALANLADDGNLSANEKITKLIPDSQRLEDKWTVLFSLATALGVATVSASAARSAWFAFLSGLSPAWNNTGADTPVDRASYNAARDGYDAALYALDQAIKSVAATRANWSGVANDGGKPADNATRNVVTYSTSAPIDPVDGDMWVDISGTYAVFKLRSGGGWVTGANALDAYNALSGKPVALSDINTTESSKLAGIAAGATVGAPIGTPVGGITAGDVSSTIISGGGVANDKVTTPAIVANAVTDPGNFVDFSGTNHPTVPIGTFYTLGSVTITTSGASDKVLLLAGVGASYQISATLGSVTHVTARVHIKRDGTLIANYLAGDAAGDYVYGQVNVIESDSPGAAGSYTYTIGIFVTQTGGSGSVKDSSYVENGTFAPIIFKR